MKKHLGQHFLRDRNILKRIVDFADIKPEDTVVEIGPGEGALTKILLEKAAQVLSVEKDVQLIEQLKQNFRQEITDNRLQLIESDILDYNLPTDKCLLVGNIPYNITGAIFKKFLESDNPPTSITFVVQKEVADRIMARDGKESILSISIKACGTPEYGGIIKKGSFYPMPKVDSAIIAVTNIKKLKDGNLEKLMKIVRRGFAHKRKLLINNLGLSKGTFDKVGLGEKVRAEELSITDWLALSELL